MARGQYPIGRSAEYYVKNKLKKLGATLITRAAGSHGLADLTAWFPVTREVWLIQVKTSRKGISVDRVKKNYGDLAKLEGTWTAKAGVFVRSKNLWISDFPV